MSSNKNDKELREVYQLVKDGKEWKEVKRSAPSRIKLSSTYLKDPPGWLGVTPLLAYAARFGKESVIEGLLNEGANIEEKDWVRILFLSFLVCFFFPLSFVCLLKSLFLSQLGWRLRSHWSCLWWKSREREIAFAKRSEY